MAALPTSILSPRQQAVLQAIRELTARHGYPPTLREIGSVVGLASASSVHHHVRILEQEGFVTRARGRPRVRALPGGG